MVKNRLTFSRTRTFPRSTPPPIRIPHEAPGGLVMSNSWNSFGILSFFEKIFCRSFFRWPQELSFRCRLCEMEMWRPWPKKFQAARLLFAACFEDLVWRAGGIKLCMYLTHVYLCVSMCICSCIRWCYISEVAAAVAWRGGGAYKASVLLRDHSNIT